MIFYSRENGRDGEKDYIDTNDLKDVYFEKETFSYIKDAKQYNSDINFSLIYEPDSNYITLQSSLADGNYAISERYDIDPIELVEQGAKAYYEEELLDNVEVIKKAKNTTLNTIKTRILEDGCLIKGTNLDIMCVIKNNDNIIGVCDNITIENDTTIKAKNHYSVVNLNALNAGEITIYLTQDIKLVGVIDSISVNSSNNQELNIRLSSSKKEATEHEITYKKSLEFNNLEEYYENRAEYITIESHTESDFDEFDDLF